LLSRQVSPQRVLKLTHEVFSDKYLLMVIALNFFCLLCNWFNFILLLLIFFLLILQVLIEVRNINFFNEVWVFSVHLTVQVRVRFILTLGVDIFGQILWIIAFGLRLRKELTLVFIDFLGKRARRKGL